MAVCPADTTWFEGPTVTWKSEARAGTGGADTMFKGLPQETVTAPPVKLNGPPDAELFGVKTTLTVAVEPDCSDGMLHCTGRLLPVGWVQTPEGTDAELKATGRPAKLSVNVMPVASSGPSFVSV